MLLTVTYWFDMEQRDLSDHSARETDISCAEFAKQKEEGIRAPETRMAFFGRSRIELVFLGAGAATYVSQFGCKCSPPSHSASYSRAATLA